MKNISLTISLFMSLVITSCVSPVKQTCVIDSKIAANLDQNVPSIGRPVTVHLTGDVSWAGKPAPIANGYFKKRLRNALSSIPGFEVSDSKNAELTIHVKRNNKFIRSEMNQKVAKVARRQSLCETSPNLYDHYFVVNSSKGKWEGNVPHGILFIYGDTKYASEVGESFKAGEQGGFIEIKDLVLADETMVRQVLVHALAAAHREGLF